MNVILIFPHLPFWFWLWNFGVSVLGTTKVIDLPSLRTSPVTNVAAPLFLWADGRNSDISDTYIFSRNFTSNHCFAAVDRLGVAHVVRNVLLNSRTVVRVEMDVAVSVTNYVHHNVTFLRLWNARPLAEHSVIRMIGTVEVVLFHLYSFRI